MNANLTLSKDRKTLTLTLPLWQNSYDAIDELIGQVPALVGIIAGQEYTISHLIDLGYKDDIQEGSPVIYFDSREELEAACELAGLSIWEHPICAYCGKVIRGSFTYSEKGNMCWDCEFKSK